MSDNNLMNNLSWLFLQASFKSKPSVIKIAEHYDLSVPQLYTLVFMQPDRPLQMNEIATLLSCDPSNVTGIIDRMFAQHYIERQEKPNDRRAKLVSLTPEGIRLRTEVVAKIGQNQPPVFDKLINSQKEQLVSLLQQLLT